MERGSRAMRPIASLRAVPATQLACARAALAMFLLWTAVARAQPLPPQPAAQPTPAEYQAAIRQLAVGATEDAGRVAQLRVALGQAEAQRDAALARVKELEASAPPPPARSKQ